MMCNRWRKFSRRKPKKEDRYQCIVKYGFGGEIKNPTIIDLYWWYAPDYGGIWIDRRRKNVFDGYNVYKSCRAATDTNRVFCDNLCERIDVIAWRKMPNVPLRWRNKTKDE